MKKKKWKSAAPFAAMAMTGAVTGLTMMQPLTSYAASTAKRDSSLTALPTSPVTLTLQVINAPNEISSVEAQVQAFEKMHPNIHIKVEGSAQAGNTQAQVAAAVAHTLPDMIWTADVLTQFEATHGILLNLSPYMKAYGFEESKFQQGMMKLGQWNGNQYVIPRGFDQVMVEYNPDLFQKFHVPLPKEGWSWNQFLEDCKRLTRKVGNTQYYAVGSNATYAWYAIYDPFMRMYGGHIVAPGGKSASVDSPAVIKGVATMMDFARNYTSWFDNLPKDPFMSGLAAMDFAVRPQIMGQLNAQRNQWSEGFNVNFVNFPLLYPHPQIGAGMSGYAVTADCKYPNAAAAFMMFLLTKQGELIRSRVAGSVPIRVDLKDSEVWRTAIQVKYPLNNNAFVDYSKFDSFPPNLPVADVGPVQTDIQNAFTEIELKKMSVTDAMKQLNDQINSVLAGNQ